MGLLDVVFPKVCVGCREEGNYICDKCQHQLITPEYICPMCGKSSLGGWVHAACRQKDGMERLLIGLPYHGMVQDCLKKVKYKQSWDVVDSLFSLCRFNDFDIEGIVTSVPMFTQKERERGFNQAELLARLLAKRFKVPHLILLERIRTTKPMYGLDKEGREENVRGAFMRSQHANLFMSPRITLVDDVWTTGATMRECARVLKQAGVHEVWGVVLAG